MRKPSADATAEGLSRKPDQSRKESPMGSVSMFPGPSESRAAERGVTALLSVVDAAEVLGVSKHYVQDRINAGELRIVELATNVRQKIRVRADDLQAFIDNRTSAGAA
ncbi:hypothetical protein DM791_08570 [Paenarthrobacter nitroguajacolicus]|nr:hypothetical protein [Paenarthrobacter nitroguajacolicus]